MILIDSAAGHGGKLASSIVRYKLYFISRFRGFRATHNQKRRNRKLLNYIMIRRSRGSQSPGTCFHLFQTLSTMASNRSSPTFPIMKTHKVERDGRGNKKKKNELKCNMYCVYRRRFAVYVFILINISHV
jgi:hypothetical protein